MYSFKEIKEFMLKCREIGFDAELKIVLNGKEYLISIYDDHCSFQRGGMLQESGVYNFTSLDELYNFNLVDNINLKRDWNKITDFSCMGIELSEFKF